MDPGRDETAAQRALPDGVQRVVQALRAAGVTAELRLFQDRSTRTAEDAARSVGAEVGRIVKSLVFMAGEEPVVVLASGAHRVDEARLASVVGSPVRRASPEQARQATGFAIGGIPPLGHPRRLRTLMDRALLGYDRVWAAAGAPNALFAVDPRELQRATGAAVVDVAER